MRKKEEKYVRDSRVAREFTRIVNATSKSQLQIARDAGFDNSNIVSMLKQGRTKMPIARIESLCSVCEANPIELLIVALKEYEPETWDLMRRYSSDFSNALYSDSFEEYGQEEDFLPDTPHEKCTHD